MKKKFIYANISIPILAGSLLYYVTSPQVIFAQNIDRLLGVSLHVGMENTFVVNLRSYMPDMLWAYALVFSLMLVTGNKTAYVWKMFVIAGMFSTIMEVLQVTGCVKGTFDVMDIIVEIIAELMAVFIIKRHHMKKIRKYIGVLLCLIVFAAMAMGSGSDTSVDNSNASGASDKTGTESDNVVMVGGSFEKDGLKGTVNDADTDFTDYDDPYGFYKPGDGKKYVKADFSFENNGKSDAYVSSADFSCYADNESCDQSFIASVNEFSGDTLSTGRKINFSVVFAVPVDAESIELEYTANIWSNEKVIIKLQ